MSNEDDQKLHPILSEITRTYVDLYTNRPNEKNRQKLIKLEAALHEHLETIRKAREDQESR